MNSCQTVEFSVLQSTPLNWDTLLPGSFSRLTENLSLDDILDALVPGVLSRLTGVPIKRTQLYLISGV